MKNGLKKCVVVLTTFAVLFSMICLPAGGQISKVEAASKKDVYFYDGSSLTVSYKPEDYITSNTEALTIIGCTKASEIKKLKSSNKKFKVKAKDGYIAVTYGDFAGTTKITCKVKGVSLKIKLTSVKYKNPVKTFKVGSKDYTSKFAKRTYYYGKGFTKKKLVLTAKSGWKIDYVYVQGKKTSSYKIYEVNKSKWSKKISLKKNGYIAVHMTQKKTGLEEYLFYDYF